jgi:hypothetical protein
LRNKTRVRNFLTRVLRGETRVRNFQTRVLRHETRVKISLTRVLRDETRVKNIFTRVLNFLTRVSRLDSDGSKALTISQSGILSGLCAAAVLAVILSLLGDNGRGFLPVRRG